MRQKKKLCTSRASTQFVNLISGGLFDTQRKGKYFDIDQEIHQSIIERYSL